MNGSFDYLNKHLREEFKGSSDPLEEVIKRAKQVIEDVERTGAENPSTYVYVLVERLMGMRKS